MKIELSDDKRHTHDNTNESNILKIEMYCFHFEKNMLANMQEVEKT